MATIKFKPRVWLRSDYFWVKNTLRLEAFLALFNLYSDTDPIAKL